MLPMLWNIVVDCAGSDIAVVVANCVPAPRNSGDLCQRSHVAAFPLFVLQ